MLLITLFFQLYFTARVFVSDPVCLICLDAPVMALFRPCGHVCACSGCAKDLDGQPCPVCRQEIHHITTTETSNTKAIHWCRAFYEQSVPDASRYRPDYREDFTRFLKLYEAEDRKSPKEDQGGTLYLGIFRHYVIDEAVNIILKLDKKNPNFKI